LELKQGREGRDEKQRFPPISDTKGKEKTMNWILDPPTIIKIVITIIIFL
jgi:hypothetical protein